MPAAVLEAPLQVRIHVRQQHQLPPVVLLPLMQQGAAANARCPVRET